MSFFFLDSFSRRCLLNLSASDSANSGMGSGKTYSAALQRRWVGGFQERERSFEDRGSEGKEEEVMGSGTEVSDAEKK